MFLFLILEFPGAQLSLSVLQRKAETEIQKAQMLVSQKDVELQEAEESLSGLQEVSLLLFNIL